MCFASFSPLEYIFSLLPFFSARLSCSIILALCVLSFVLPLPLLDLYLFLDLFGVLELMPGFEPCLSFGWFCLSLLSPLDPNLPLVLLTHKCHAQINMHMIHVFDTTYDKVCENLLTKHYCVLFWKSGTTSSHQGLKPKQIPLFRQILQPVHKCHYVTAFLGVVSQPDMSTDLR